MRRCPKCGAVVSETANFCKVCGEPLFTAEKIDESGSKLDADRNENSETLIHDEQPQEYSSQISEESENDLSLYASLICWDFEIHKNREWQVETEDGMISIILPRDVQDGQTVMYREKGQISPVTGKRGTLYVTVTIEKTTFWQRYKSQLIVVGCVSIAIILAASLAARYRNSQEPIIPSEPASTDMLQKESTEVYQTIPAESPQIEHVHVWEAATYDRPKTCTVCGATEGEPLPRPGFRIADKLASGNYHSVLLRDDGTVIAAGYNGMGSKANYGGRCDTEDWGDMVCVAASSHTAGVRADGTVVATGLNESGQCYVEDWYDIASVAVSNHHTVGLRYDGTVVAVGANDYGQCEVSDWEDIIQVAASEETTYGLRSDGRILSVGKRSFGSGWINVKKIAASAYNLVALLEDGTVVQEGGSSGWDDTTDDWHDIVDIASGGAHTLGLTADGRVVGVMSPLSGRDHGQCDVYSWEDIVDISAGMFFSVGLRSDGTIVAVGDDTHGELDIRWVEE